MAGVLVHLTQVVTLILAQHLGVEGDDVRREGHWDQGDSLPVSCWSWACWSGASGSSVKATCWAPLTRSVTVPTPVVGRLEGDDGLAGVAGAGHAGYRGHEQLDTELAFGAHHAGVLGQPARILGRSSPAISTELAGAGGRSRMPERDVGVGITMAHG